MTPLDVAREIFPGRPDEWLDFAIWNHTSFPFSRVEKWTADLREFKDALERCPEGMFLCDFCNRNFVRQGQWICHSCDWNVHCFDETEI